MYYKHLDPQIRRLDFDKKKDGGEMEQLSDNMSEQFYALWISRDPDELEAQEIKTFGHTYAFESITKSDECSSAPSIAVANTSSKVHERSFGQEIVLKSIAKKDVNAGSKITVNEIMAGASNIEVIGQDSNMSEYFRAEEEINAASEQFLQVPATVAAQPTPHKMAKYWQEQIERAKVLDTSNNQCQMEGTYEEMYQTIEV